MSRTICAALVAAIREATDPLKRTYEIVIADDFSSDNSWTVLKELAAGGCARARAAVRVQLRAVGGALGGHERGARQIHHHA